jgi:hypothetical protein
MDQQKSKLVGCDDFLPKPVNAEKLFELVKTYLALEWVYREDGETFGRVEELPPPSLAPPPPEELELLFDLALRGNMGGIRERAVKIAQADDRYGPFTDHLLQLTQDFQDKEILTFIEQFIEGDE